MASEQKIQAALDSLYSHDRETRLKAIQKLGKRGREEAVLPLIALLSDADWKIRRFTAAALGAVGDERAIAPLSIALGDKSQGVRNKAAGSLGKIKGEPAIAPLCRALGDRKRPVRTSAMYALVEIGLDAVPALCKQLQPTGTVKAEATILTLRTMQGRFTLQVAYNILAAPELTANLRYLALDVLKTDGIALFSSSRQFHDVQKFCEKSLQVPSEAVRAGAQSVLDYLTLGRASERYEPTEPQTLLRAAYSTENTAGANVLLRPSAAETTQKAEKTGLRERLRRLLKG